jgi:hypothetical protein
MHDNHPTRARFAAVTLAVVALGMIGPGLLAAAEQAAGSEAELIAIGFKIAPVPLDLRGKPAGVRALIGLGSYLVNTGGCNDCHTNPSFAEGGDPYLGQPEQINTEGYLGGGQEFGPFISRNITPDADGKPAGLTQAQFLEVMHKGTDFEQLHPQISPLLQVMPWPVFGKKTKHELVAIYEYLRAIPSIPESE